MATAFMPAAFMPAAFMLTAAAVLAVAAPTHGCEFILRDFAVGVYVEARKAFAIALGIAALWEFVCSNGAVAVGIKFGKTLGFGGLARGFHLVVKS